MTLQHRADDSKHSHHREKEGIRRKTSALRLIRTLQKQIENIATSAALTNGRRIVSTSSSIISTCALIYVCILLDCTTSAKQRRHTQGGGAHLSSVRTAKICRRRRHQHHHPHNGGMRCMQYMISSFVSVTKSTVILYLRLKKDGRLIELEHVCACGKSKIFKKKER